MILLPSPVVGGMLAAVLASTSLDPSPLSTDNSAIASTIPVLEVIKVYGKMAGPECYGKVAPKGSSCQITSQDLERIFHLDKKTSTTTTLTLEEFQAELDKADFQWPLKPYGIEKSNSKTATMNKGAETRVFMEELEARALYDKRNPTGPLPTSLRPQLNSILQREGTDARTVETIFGALGGSAGELKTAKLEEMVSSNAIDYYDFIALIGKESILWPY
jgi:hypothetical protein